MRQRWFLVLAWSVLLSMGLGFGQAQAQTGAQTTTQAEAEASGLSGEQNLRFGEWARLCEQPAGLDRSVCHLAQVRTDENSGQVVAQIAISRDRDSGKLGLLLTVPLGIWLPDGLSVSLDGEPLRRVPIATCAPDGCVTGFAINAKEEAALLAAKSMVLVFSADGQAFEVDVPLDGLEQGLGALSAGARS